MPSQRPAAAFDPIPPDLDLAALVEETPNFEYVTRVSCDMIEDQSMEAFEKLILLHVIMGGKPLVIEGFQRRLDEWTFTSQWLKDNCGSKFENARNITKQSFMPLSIGHYLNNLSKLTNQWTSTNYRESDRQRIYLKDIDCPPLWYEKLEEHVPPVIFYLNESTGDIGGPGAPDVIPTKKYSYAKGRGIARAGDLMSSLPSEMRADNLMCYIGHEGTYTPAHREMCASLGQNLMVETTGTVDEDGKPAKPGSSIWFMTESKDRHLVSEYWLSTLGHDMEVEKHFAQINAWKAAPFTTYIVEQKAGDFILIPPLAAHQVWNRGTRTMKVAWNRTTVETLEMALHEALPRARMVCRDEQYKNKAIVYFTLQNYSDLINKVDALKEGENDSQAVVDLKYNTKLRQLNKDFKRLFALYTEMLLSEILAPVSPNEKRGQYLPYDGFVTCSYCRCNIFNRFLTCESCIEPLQTGEENTYDICMDCFAMGRGCKCISGYKWVEQFPWQELTERHEQWRHQIIRVDGGVNHKTPRSLQKERKDLGKKTLAQICQEQLKVRPWNDPKNPKPQMTTAEMNTIGSIKNGTVEDDNRTPNKNSKRRKLPSGFVYEHVSCYPREAWKCATCAKCDRSYQYGSLWRMFDLMPQSAMEEYEWECPACRRICSCGSCRRKDGNYPYEPRGTVLGHDTRKVADPRSVESLVDFSMSNLHHIKKTGDDDPLDSRRLSRHIDEAARAKAHDPSLSDNYVDEEEAPPVQEQFYQNGIRFTTEPDIPIDPMLSTGQPVLPTVTASVASNAHKTPRRRQGAEVDDDRNRRQSMGKKKAKQKQGGRRVNQNQQNSSTDSVYGSGINLRAPTSVAPTAQMSSHDDPATSRESNVMTYEYPEPSAIGSSTSGQYPSMNGQSLTSSDLQMLHGDQTVRNQDVSHYQQAQIDRSLQEAKRNNRFTIAEAAFSGKSLPVTLRLGRLGMALMADRLGGDSTTQGDQATVVEKELLFSDMPAPEPPQKVVSNTKKRKLREEDVDDDFSTRKRRNRKNHIAQVVQDNGQNLVDESAMSSESDTPGGSFVAVNKPRGPRKLPKYLAEQHEDGDLPAELPPEPPRRRSVPGDKSRSSILNKALSTTKVAQINNRNLSGPSSQDVADENRKAKRKAVQWADGESGDGSSGSEDNTAKHLPAPASTLSKATSSLMKIPQSMFSRMAGRKIKIAGAKSKASGTDRAASNSAKVK